MKSRKGITLVALVITVIILLILAGITLHLTVGQEGIIKRAKQAGENYIDAQEEEEKQLSYMLAETENSIIKGNGDTSNNREYGYFFVEKDDNKSSDTKVALNKIEGNMSFNDINKTTTLKQGKHYYICFSARAYGPGKYGDIILYNETRTK